MNLNLNLIHGDVIEILQSLRPTTLAALIVDLEEVPELNDGAGWLIEGALFQLSTIVNDATAAALIEAAR